MKPKDLPFYDVATEKAEIVFEKVEPSYVEEKVSKVRTFVQDNTKPIQTAVGTVARAAADIKQKGNNLYSRINDQDTLFNISVIGGSAISGWMVNALLFRRSGRLRRMLVPVAFGSVAAAYLYPDTALELWKDTYARGKRTFDEVKDKVAGKT